MSALALGHCAPLGSCIHIRQGTRTCVATITCDRVISPDITVVIKVKKIVTFVDISVSAAGEDSEVQGSAN